MKKLSQIINEVLTPKVHYNVGISTLKGIARNSKCNTARFVIDKNNKMNVGDAEHFTHDDIGYDFINTKTTGFFHHDPKKNSYEHYPRMSKFEKMGYKEMNKEDFNDLEMLW